MPSPIEHHGAVWQHSQRVEKQWRHPLLLLPSFFAARECNHVPIPQKWPHARGYRCLFLAIGTVHGEAKTLVNTKRCEGCLGELLQHCQAAIRARKACRISRRCSGLDLWRNRFRNSHLIDPGWLYILKACVPANTAIMVGYFAFFLTWHVFSVLELRTGYHSLAVPVHVSGIGGPGAPHFFEYRRRSDVGQGWHFQFDCFS